jgi:hypothetical protein
MNRLLYSLVTLLPLLFWDKLSRFLFAPASDPSHASGHVKPTIALGVAQFAGVDEASFGILAVLGLAYSTIFGLLTHLMLAERGFGAKMNGLVGLFGGGAVVACWFAFVPKTAFSYSGIFFTTIVGSTTLLAAACVLKSVAFSMVDGYFSGAAPARDATSARIVSIASRRR